MFPPGKLSLPLSLTRTLCQTASNLQLDDGLPCQVWRLASPHRQSNPVGRINLHPGQSNERLWNADYVRLWRERERERRGGKRKVASERNRRINGRGIRIWGNEGEEWMDDMEDIITIDRIVEMADLKSTENILIRYH